RVGTDAYRRVVLHNYTSACECDLIYKSLAADQQCALSHGCFVSECFSGGRERGPVNGKGEPNRRVAVVTQNVIPQPEVRKKLQSC
ncbi:hypothetical protein JOB18_005988, partial [Solea senegalensis]